MAPSSKTQEPVFPDGAPYVRITLKSALTNAENSDYKLHQRVYWATLARANQDGHAQFSKGELANILGNEIWVDGEAGEDGEPVRVAVRVPARDDTVSKAIQKARNLKLIGEESCSRCLVVDHKEVRQGRGGRGCFTHGLYVWEPALTG